MLTFGSKSKLICNEKHLSIEQYWLIWYIHICMYVCIWLTMILTKGFKKLKKCYIIEKLIFLVKWLSIKKIILINFNDTIQHRYQKKRNNFLDDTISNI